MKRWIATCAILGLGITAAVACSQQAVNVPVRTFERAQKVDVVCLQVLAPDPNNPGYGLPIAPVPVVQSQCAPVPPNTDGSSLPYHLYALVTQTGRGELAVVDLTAGRVIDGDRSTPGINFIPVGAQPTDVAVTPDGKIAFVAAAEVNKPAIYGIPSKGILGDSQGLPADVSPPPPTLPSWPVCALAQAPSSITVVPKTLAPGAGDGGTAIDTGVLNYQLVVVLPGDARSSAKVVTIDAAPFLRGAGLDQSPGATVNPGALLPCIFEGQVELSADLPATWQPGPTWDDGVKYIEGGVDLSDAGPKLSAESCGTTTPAGGSTEAGASDAGAPSEAGAAGEGATFAFGSLRPHASSSARDGQTLYVADDQVPVIHVIDLSHADGPRELAPLLATSVNDPIRKVSIRTIAVSPTTSDYKRFLYAIDQKDGSLIVYDITNISDPKAPRTPLLRPHAELNPFQPPDRIIFNVPAAAVSFVQHDFFLTKQGDTPMVAAKSGLICNPNPNAGLDQGPFVGSDQKLGAYYRANVANQEVALGPGRLRGIFAFVTLTNGQMVAIDVDDWDAPCRRPDPMDEASQSSAIAPPQPKPTSPSDTNPYHVPLAFEMSTPGSSPVSLEAFFPVSAPHRPRSLYLLRNDPSTGNHAPSLTGVPQLFKGSSVQATNVATTPALMIPTVSTLADPSYVENPTEPDPGKRNKKPGQIPDIRFSWEDPQVHLDQNWLVTYEGSIPGFDGLAATVESTEKAPAVGYQTLTLANPQALFCRKGIEDFRVGSARAIAQLSAMEVAKMPRPPGLERKVSDYVEVTDEILDVADPYWSEQDNECWDDLATASGPVRHDACLANYGTAADENVQRDFPILEAYNDKLVVGRFGYTGATSTTTSREVVDVRGLSDAQKQNNAKFLKRMRCCFHHQVRFHVRAGGQWVTEGSAVGFLHHMTADATTGACVTSCEPRESLLNSRAPSVLVPDANAVTFPDRNSPLAMRNPMFSFVMVTGPSPTRDLVWKFSTRGQFTPLIVSIATSTTSVSPQSMRFIDSLGQLALVDAASQGLVLIDLNTVSLAHAPYF